MSLSKIQVAIDGPSASGKSTAARLVAEALGFVYVDSGSLYRGITWQCLEEGVEPEEEGKVSGLLDRIRVDGRCQEGSVIFFINGEDPGPALRGGAVVGRVSDVASISFVRNFIVERLRETCRFGNLVMEGRDIGTVVFPDTEYKYYIDALAEERALRRHREIAMSEGAEGVSSVRNALQERDFKDTTREVSPLQIADGARVIDSTRLSIDEVVAEILRGISGTG